MRLGNMMYQKGNEALKERERKKNNESGEEGRAIKEKETLNTHELRSRKRKMTMVNRRR